jgi:hypothetical protein
MFAVRFLQKFKAVVGNVLEIGKKKATKMRLLRGVPKSRVEKKNVCGLALLQNTTLQQHARKFAMTAYNVRFFGFSGKYGNQDTRQSPS